MTHPTLLFVFDSCLLRLEGDFQLRLRKGGLKLNTASFGKSPSHTNSSFRRWRKQRLRQHSGRNPVTIPRASIQPGPSSTSTTPSLMRHQYTMQLRFSIPVYNGLS
ncbi:hypothetical protein BKA56DRAFT_706956 [Ilyonectria sp. MPI-CAGE-AT-0026]|nr:hypothetical protein BKA56DRAFT_706956 [Ilyonectria sp. MPI-CAGE-AT-0026]